MNLAVTVSTSSSSVNSSIVSKSPVIFKASSRQIGCSGKPDVKSQRNSNPDAASSSQGWQKDALLDVCTGKLVATDKDQESLNFPETVCTGKLVAPGYGGYPGNLGTPGNSEDSESEGRIWPHHFHVSSDCAPHMEKVFSIVRQTCGRNPTDNLNDIDVNTAVWSIFMSVTLQAAVHFGQEKTEHLQSTKNQPLKSVKQLFQTTERLIKDQAEITGLSTIDWK